MFCFAAHKQSQRKKKKEKRPPGMLNRDQKLTFFIFGPGTLAEKDKQKPATTTTTKQPHQCDCLSSSNDFCTTTHSAVKCNTSARLTFFTPGPAVPCRADAGSTDGVAACVVVTLTLPWTVVAPGSWWTGVVAQTSPSVLVGRCTPLWCDRMSTLSHSCRCFGIPLQRILLDKPVG